MISYAIGEEPVLSNSICTKSAVGFGAIVRIVRDTVPVCINCCSNGRPQPATFTLSVFMASDNARHGTFCEVRLAPPRETLVESESPTYATQRRTPSRVSLLDLEPSALEDRRR